jgi:CBS domain-containing protein
MIVEDVMSAPAITIAPNETLHEAIGRMLQNRVGSLVVGNGGIEGIITRSDVLRAAYHAGGSLEDLPVSRGMSTDVETITKDRTVRTAIEQMEEHNIKKLPVVEDFELIGIVTLTDIGLYQPERVRETRESLERKDEWTD